MTHTTELDNLENRLKDSGWIIIEKEQEFYNHKGKTLGDIDLLALKVNHAGMNMVYFEEKSGKERLGKAKRQIAKGMKYIIDTYNPHRLWGFYAHKRDIKLIERYER
jgi:hypothetical protein